MAAPEDPPPICPLCGASTSAAAVATGGGGGGWGGRASVKRKLESTPPPVAEELAARVEISDEAAALREALSRLQAELEAERGAAAGAASEAMSMILRLQREKAEALMDARQFRRFAEEKFSHDAAELAALDDLLACRDALLHSYHSRLLHLGLSPPSSPTAIWPHLDPPFPDDYPPLRCAAVADHPVEAEADSPAETPREHLHKLEHRIHLLERMPSRAADKTVVSCGVRPPHIRTFSADSFGSGIEFPLVVDREPDIRDDISDRVYTIDAVHEDYLGAKATIATSSPVGWVEEEEIQKLSARLQALEADRESMRQAIISMGTEKAQVVLLKEIAQQLCKEAAPLPTQPPPKPRPGPRPQLLPQRKVVKREPFFSRFFVVSVVKWIQSVVFWRKKSSRIKYPIGLCGSNVGLLLLLEQSPKLTHQRFITRT